MDERTVFFREGSKGVKSETNHRTVVETKRNIAALRGKPLCQFLRVKPLGCPNLLTVNFVKFEVKS